MKYNLDRLKNELKYIGTSAKADYLYFLKEVEVPTKVMLGGTADLKFLWENRSFSSVFKPFKLKIRLMNIKDRDIYYSCLIEDSGNLRWMLDSPAEETYKIEIPKSLKKGVYNINIALILQDENTDRIIEMALKDILKNKEGDYTVAYVEVY